MSLFLGDHDMLVERSLIVLNVLKVQPQIFEDAFCQLPKIKLFKTPVTPS